MFDVKELQRRGSSTQNKIYIKYIGHEVQTFIREMEDIAGMFGKTT